MGLERASELTWASGATPCSREPATLTWASGATSCSREPATLARALYSPAPWQVQRSRHTRVTCGAAEQERWGPHTPRTRELHQDDSPCAVTVMGSLPKQDEITVTEKREKNGRGSWLSATCLSSAHSPVTSPGDQEASDWMDPVSVPPTCGTLGETINLMGPPLTHPAVGLGLLPALPYI